MDALRDLLRPRQLVAFSVGAATVMLLHKYAHALYDESRREDPNDTDNVHEAVEQEVPATSPLAQQNQQILAEFQTILKSDPEIDTGGLLMQIEEGIQHRQHMANVAKDAGPLRWNPANRPLPPMAERTETERQFAFKALPTLGQEMNVVRPFSSAFKSELGLSTDMADAQPGDDTTVLLQAVKRCIESAETLWQTASGTTSLARCSPNAVVKIKSCRSRTPDTTEYSALQYLQEHLPDFPAPRPHGLMMTDTHTYSFISFVPGMRLGTVWKELDESQKVDLSAQIDDAFQRLRGLPVPDGQPFGGIAGEGCKDGRWSSRRSKEPIHTYKQFLEWQTSEPTCTASNAFLDFWKAMAEDLEPGRTVFTHGDLHAMNIMVKEKKEGGYELSGIIDWEESGFYPEYFESTKATRLLNASSTDWFTYLPHSVSPFRYPLHWHTMNEWAKMVD